MMRKLFVFFILITAMLVACGVPAAVPNTPRSGAPNGAFVIEAESSAKPFLHTQTSDGVDLYASFLETGKIKNHMVNAVSGTYKSAQAFMSESPAWIPTAMTGGITIASSKMVLGMTAQKLAELGLKPGDVITFGTLIERINDKSLVPMLCNPTQCNSGLMFYLSALIHISGKFSLELNLTDKSEKSSQIIAQAQTLMQNITISTSSTADARDAMHKSLIESGSYNAFWSYESEIAALDTQLVSEGKAPLYVVYIDGAIDAAQTLVMNPVYAKDDAVKAAFDKVVKSLSENKTNQAAIGATGWRPSLYGVPVSTSVLKTEWGFQLDPNVATSFAPRFDVAMPLMRTYVTVIRKPVILFFFDDFSGSMNGNGGKQQLLSASQYLFSDAAATDFLDATEGDVTQVFLFDNKCVPLQLVVDANPDGYKKLLANIQISTLGGSTSMFACGKAGYKVMADNYKQACATTHNCAFVFMTDGGDNECDNSNSCTTVGGLNQAKVDLGLSDIPTWVIPFGSGVNYSQINAIANVQVCDDTIVACFQKIKGSR